MATIRKTSTRRLVRKLQRDQEKQRALLVKVEKTATRLEGRRVKLQALEGRIADLERHLANPQRRRAASADEDGLRQARLIFNPSAGRDAKDNAARLATIVTCLRAHGIAARIGLKTSGKVGRQLAREAVLAKVPLVVVAAGDGTIEDVASQLVGTETVLGIVPIGTMNNLARSLGVPLDIDDACALIGMGTTRHIDVGRLISNDSPHVEYFLEGAGIGLASIAALSGQTIEKHHWRFVPRALLRLFESKQAKIEVQLDDTIIEVASRIITVANSPLMGSNLLVAPDAKMDDGWLDVMLYDGMGTADLVSHFLAASKGKSENVRMHRARHVRISADAPLPSNSDKDVTRERREIEMEIVPGALSVIAGNGIGLTHPVESAPAAPPLTGEPPSANGHAEVEADAAVTPAS
jgi:diacylglycerol kinase (ATP)